MKKLFIIALALMMASTVYAEDRLSLSGQFRVRAWDKNFDNADDHSYFDQRFRMGGTIKVSEGITGHFRMDLTETIWGGKDTKLGKGGWTRGLAGEDESIHVDRAYLQVDKELFKLRAGQFYNSFGSDIVVDYQSTGFALDIKCPVTISLAYAKLDENGGAAEDVTDEKYTEDADFYGLQVAYAADTFGVKVYYAAIDDGNLTEVSPTAAVPTPVVIEDKPWVVGLSGNVSFGTVNVGGELDFFGGEVDAGAVDADYKGTQLFLDANCTAVENAKFGFSFMWADSQDGGDIQRTALYAGGETFNPYGWSGSLLDYQYPVGSLFGGLGGQFDPNGTSSGVVAGVLYAEYKLADVQLYAKLSYLEPEDDTIATTDLEDALVFAASIEYPVYKGFALAGGYLYSDKSYEGAKKDDTDHILVGQMKISF